MHCWDIRIEHVSTKVWGYGFASQPVLSTESTTLCPQIELREREIERLSHALDGGRSPDVLSLETRNKTNEKLIAQLNIQVMALSVVSLSI